MEKQELLETIIANPSVRQSVTFGSHYWFFHTYLSSFVKYETAPFQQEIFRLTENIDTKTLAIVAFRGSAKSTIMTLSYPIWSIVGAPQKKYVLIVCQTQQQAQQTLSNIKAELELNKLLYADFGSFASKKGEWNSESLVLDRYSARITVVSVSQSMRGIRHRQYRPDLIICDDIEDMQSAKTKEGRDKLWQFVNSELIPSGDQNTKIVFIGNLVHEDSLMMRIKKAIAKKRIDGIYKQYPLIKGDQILWPGKFTDKRSIEKLRKKTASDSDFLREFMLKIIPDGDQIVLPEWIARYDSTLPIDTKNLRCAVICVDPAISENQRADKTAIVIFLMYGYHRDINVRVMPIMVNKRMGMPETLRTIIDLQQSLIQYSPLVLVEDVAYQKSLIQMLQTDGVNVKGIQIGGSDKRSRLTLTSSWIQNGKVLFPDHGADELIGQIVHFGVEAHDDLVDAFTLGFYHFIVEASRSEPKITWL